MHGSDSSRRLFLKSAGASALTTLGACGGGGGGGGGGSDSGGGSATGSTSPYAMGWTEASSDTYAALSRMDATSFSSVSPSYFSAGIASLDLTDTGELARAGWPSLLPRPGDQGAQGSCVAWGVAYATATSSNVVAGAGDATSLDRVGSPADLYAKLMRRETWNTCGKGTIIKDAMDIMVEEGVQPLSRVSYSDRSCTAPSATGQIFLDGYAKIAVTDRAAIKRALEGMHILPFGMRVYSDFFGVGSQVYSGPSAGAKDSGGHCMAIVGYDDASGCYKVQNSWGTNWGSGGFLRIAYGSFERLASEIYVPFNYSQQMANHLYDQKDSSGAGRIKATQGNVYVAKESGLSTYTVTLAFRLSEWLALSSYNLVLWTPSGNGGFQSHVVSDNRSVQSLRGGAFTASGISASVLASAQIASINLGGKDRNGVLTQLSLFLRMNQGR